MSYKHYRLLNEGEPIHQGDEWHNAFGKWIKCIVFNGGAPLLVDDWLYRRPLGSETCDHYLGCVERECDDEPTLVRVSLLDYAGYQWIKKLPYDPKFNFCPLCGMPLTQP